MTNTPTVATKYSPTTHLMSKTAAHRNHHYNALNTCNTWTGSVLKKAGVRIGMWTPLPGGVMRWF